jgi:hypothetical protein
MQPLFIAFVLAATAGSTVAQMPGIPSLTAPAAGTASSPSVTSMSNEDLAKQYCELQKPSQPSSQSGSSMMSSMSSKGAMTDAAKQAANDKMKSQIADELNRRSIKLPGCS